MSTTSRIVDHVHQASSDTETILQDRIRTRAYEIYEQRGKQDGFAERDWLEAEAEILAANVSRDVRFSSIARERAIAFETSRRQAALSRAARWAEKTRPGRAGV